MSKSRGPSARVLSNDGRSIKTASTHVPSTVVTAQPSMEARGARQALTAMCRGLRAAGSHTETITVQAPQPPCVCVHEDGDRI